MENETQSTMPEKTPVRKKPIEIVTWGIVTALMIACVIIELFCPIFQVRSSIGFPENHVSTDPTTHEITLKYGYSVVDMLSSSYLRRTFTGSIALDSEVTENPTPDSTENIRRNMPNNYDRYANMATWISFCNDYFTYMKEDLEREEDATLDELEEGVEGGFIGRSTYEETRDALDAVIEGKEYAYIEILNLNGINVFLVTAMSTLSSKIDNKEQIQLLNESAIVNLIGSYT